ncbi:uncharacterized protein BHQ10_002504 [Talaromyces amestolkiae]|uniref:Uncharacterized protein n=1 Tax=Talaromyces amestolkiae TaxID=1196081 RepID=A0A364KSF7_TALAM|nr:uncharacterized protein BHQ10_002504 [Talaromyces amestolkiae]RAO66492.1 hypothetical protein BHQ10_002504 [Talaromyces amestolkiae]
MPSYLITGASRGLGYGFLRQISADPNNTVIALVRDKPATDARVSAELSDRKNIFVIHGDLTDVQSLKTAVEETSKITAGSLDVLIANAAYVGNYARFDGMGDLDVEPLGADLRQHFESNVIGNINLFNLFLPLIRNGNLKKIVAISSGLSELDLIKELRIANGAPYSITKAALNMVVTKFHAQYADEGILFMAVCPGSVATGNFDNLTPEEEAKAGVMFQKFMKYAPHFTGPAPVDDAVKDVLQVVENATIETNGGTLVSHFVSRSKGKNKKNLLKLPLIGDLHSSPIETPLSNWDAWAQENGPIVVPRLFGLIPIVVLNSFDAVTELFSRRSQWYSNRPGSVSMEMITGAKLGQCKFTLMHDYDDQLKLHHRILSPSLGAPAVARYQPLIELECKQLLFDLCKTAAEAPLDGIISTKTVYPLLERTQSSLILALHYGLRIPSYDEKILQEVFDTQTQVTHLAANPRLPDMIPPLRHLPAFLSPWKRSADKLHATQVDLNMRLLRHGKDSAGWNATKQALATAKKHATNEIPELDIAFTLATSVQGGMETSPRQLLWLFIAALHKPSFMGKAHAILDDVVGRERLPRFSDRSNLAFIDAITHELFRWRPIAPGSIPRRADKDDELNGVKISKGWTIMANAWAIGRDEKVFVPSLGDLHDFVPERWLQKVEQDGKTKLRTDLPLPVFGQGRRTCQGKRVATDGAFMLIASLIWAFDIEPVNGVIVNPWQMVVAGFMTMPGEVNFKLRPRGTWAVDVIRREWETAEKALEKIMGRANDVEQ